MAVHLLDLPDLCLEKIFSYCLRNLDELKQCNQFLMEFIESHKRLKKPEPTYIELHVNTKGDNDVMQKKLEGYWNTNKIYDSVSISYNNDNSGESESEDEFEEPVENTNCSDITLEMVVEKNAEFIENFCAYLEGFSMKYVLQSLKLTKNLKNLVKIALHLNGEDGLWKNLTSQPYMAEFENFNFPKLKELEIDTDLGLPLNLFAGCKTIESFDFHVLWMTNANYKFFKILQNCKKSLKTLSVAFGHCKILGEDSNLLTTFLSNFQKCDLNLEEFNFTLYYRCHVIDGEEFALHEFLVSQKNLTDLRISARLNWNFFLIFGKTLPHLENLKNLTLDIGGPDLKTFAVKESVKESVGWKLCEIQNIKVQVCDFSEMSSDLASYIFRFPSDKLKEISLDYGKMDFNGGLVEKMAKSYKFITKFEMKGVLYQHKNYSCNDIFFILKYLKKLQVLTFAFPQDSVLDSSRFDDSVDLVLPEIEKVELQFNDSVQNNHLLKFMQFLKNMSEFTYIPWKNIDDESFYIITKELPNLTSLRKQHGFKTNLPDNFGKPSLAALQIMKANIENFNMNASKFKYNWYTIDDIIKHITEKSDEFFFL